jgi:hypothetical protein
LPRSGACAAAIGTLGAALESRIRRDRFARIMRRFRLLAFAFALAAALPARAATDYTDIWWSQGGGESGWGINLAQNASTIFATFYVYSMAGAPVWYTALLTRTVGETFTGPVYATSGAAWFGAPVWVPPSATAAVGSAAFAGLTPYRGTLTYTIDSVPVSKTIERTTLAPLNVSGTYLGAVTGRRSNCPVSGRILDPMQFVITQSGSPGVVRIEQLSTVDGAPVCTMEGTGIQHGGLIDIPDAAYACIDISGAAAHVIGLRPTATGFEARWVSDLGGGCTESGNLSGATQGV